MLTEALTPEQRKAIKVLQEHLPQWKEFLCDDITRRDICYTDFKAFTTQKISYSDLHHGTNWTWNQSNAKKKVNLENDLYAVVQKFNTRKKRKNIPSTGIIFKLWIFTVYKHNDNSFFGIFVWCEKGLPPVNSNNSNINNNSLPHLNLTPSSSSSISLSGGLHAISSTCHTFPAPVNSYSFPSSTSSASSSSSTSTLSCVNSYFAPLPPPAAPIHVNNNSNYYSSIDDDFLLNLASSGENYLSSVSNITLDDLDFLRPFVDPQTAFSFGW